MTFITKPTLAVKTAPLIQGRCGEEVITMRRPNRTAYLPGNVTHRTFNIFIWTAIVTFLVTMIGITSALMLYRQYLQGLAFHRYTRFCTIPIKIKDSAYYEPKYRVMPLRWSESPEHDVQVLSTAPEAFSDDVVDTLREEFDIGDSIEKISVMDNGRQVSFIHDFDANLTGIVDSDRCFTMQLDPSVVVSPEVLVLSISRGSPFDVTRVRAALRATLPSAGERATLPLRMPKDLLEHCKNKPTYELMKDEGGIRKRSVDFPSHDYIAFSGRHVQEIEITNLADLLQHEQDASQPQP